MDLQKIPGPVGSQSQTRGQDPQLSHERGQDPRSSSRALNQSSPAVAAKSQLFAEASSQTLSTGSAPDLDESGLRDDDSVRSTFVDRPGFCNPADTLSVSLVDALANENGSGRIAFDELSKLALREGFNLHANIHEAEFAEFTSKFQSAYRLNNVDCGETDVTLVLEDPRSQANFTFVAQKTQPPHWPKDSLFYGKSSAHFRTSDFNYPLSNEETTKSILTRRKTAWSRLGLSQIARISNRMGYANKHADGFRIPESTYILSQRSDAQNLRHVKKRATVNMALDGGNLLTNGAPSGRRVLLVGLDTIPVTQAYLDEPGNNANATNTEDHIRSELELSPGDKLIFLEQPSYHLDMSMMFCGEQEIVLNDTRARIVLENRENLTSLEDLDEETQTWIESISRIEDHVARQLEAEGLNVHRKPWAGFDLGARAAEPGISYSFFNGELVSASNNRLLYVTNGHPTTDALSNELEASVSDFLAKKDIDVSYISGASAKHLLDLGGGIGCQTNGVIS